MANKSVYPCMSDLKSVELNLTFVTSDENNGEQNSKTFTLLAMVEKETKTSNRIQDLKSIFEHPVKGSNYLDAKDKFTMDQDTQTVNDDNFSMANSLQTEYTDNTDFSSNRFTYSDNLQENTSNKSDGTSYSCYPTISANNDSRVIVNAEIDRVDPELQIPVNQSNIDLITDETELSVIAQSDKIETATDILDEVILSPNQNGFNKEQNRVEKFNRKEDSTSCCTECFFGTLDCCDCVIS